MAMRIECARCDFEEWYDIEVKRCPRCGSSLAAQKEAREAKAKDDDALKGAIRRIR